MVGVPAKTIAFLGDLREHNDRDWFDANRERYEASYVGPAQRLVLELGERLSRIVPGIVAEPVLDRSILRIDRDVRVATDDRPYKDHVDLWFWEGDRDEAVSGFFLRVTPDTVGIGVGAHAFTRPQLEAYRDLVAHASAGACLIDVVRDVERSGFEVRGQHYERVPSGYDVNGERERLIRFNALWTGGDVEHPPVLHNGRFAAWCMNRWEKQAPLHRWLVDELQEG